MTVEVVANRAVEDAQDGSCCCCCCSCSIVVAKRTGANRAMTLLVLSRLSVALPSLNRLDYFHSCRCVSSYSFLGASKITTVIYIVLDQMTTTATSNRKYVGEKRTPPPDSLLTLLYDFGSSSESKTSQTQTFLLGALYFLLLTETLSLSGGNNKTKCDDVDLAIEPFLCVTVVSKSSPGFSYQRIFKSDEPAILFSYCFSSHSFRCVCR